MTVRLDRVKRQWPDNIINYYRTEKERCFKMANPQFVKEFEALCNKCLKDDGTPKKNAAKNDLDRMAELKSFLDKDVSDQYPNVKTSSRTKKYPKSLNVCGNTIPVTNDGKTIDEVDPKKRRAILKRRKQAQKLGIDEERI